MPNPNPLRIILIFLLTFNCHSLFSQNATEPDPHRGMYIDKFVKTPLSTSSRIDSTFSILSVDANFDGVFEKEDSILKYASDNHITYLNLYDLHKVIGRNLMVWDENLKREINLEAHLNRFMKKAKSKYGITQLGAVSGSDSFFDSLLYFMDRYPEADFDVLNIEYEFWTNCSVEYPNYVNIQQAMYDAKQAYNLAHPTNPIMTEAYLAALFTCNSSFGQQNAAESIDGCTNCSPCAGCPNPQPRYSDRILYAWYISNPGSMNLTEQNLFELSSTEDSTDFHPLLYSESFNTGGTANFTGAWFPLAPQNNIFTAEEAYYTAWRNNSGVAFGTSRQNNVQPGGVHWFTATNMVGYLDKAQILQNTGPYCESGSPTKIAFNYYGPIENDIAFQFWISKDDDSSIVYPSQGGKISGVSGVYQALTSGTPLIKNINFNDTLQFPPCYLSSGNYTAHIVLNYENGNGKTFQCDNPVIIDNRPRLEVNGPKSFCEGRNTFLHVNNFGGTITWYRNGDLIASNAADLAVTADGDYFCIINGGSGCTGNSDTVHVHVLPNPSIAVNSVCNLDGTVTLKTNLLPADPLSTKTTGPGGVQYRWNTGDSTDQITVTPPSTNTGYRVNVTNPYSGCTRTAQLTIKSPLVAPYNASISILNQPSSSCSSDGTLMANLFSNGGPNNYLWSNGATTRTISNVPPGNYSVAMNVWAFGCTSFASINLGSPPANLPVIQPVIQNATCTGEASGSIQLSISGGNPPFSFFWESFPDDSIHDPFLKDQIMLKEGTYRVRISDAGGCNYYDTFEIQNIHIAPVIQSISTTHVSGCASSLNGTATVFATGGNPPYSYLWNDQQQQITQTATGLRAGSTKITVADVDGCATMNFAHVSSTELPIRIELLDSSKTELNCIGSADGSLYLRISGGILPYSVASAWVADSNFAMLQNLGNGTYPIDITDGSGCIHSDSFYISEPEAIQIFSMADSATCMGCANGSINISFLGGHAPYQLSVQPAAGIITGNTIHDLPGGIYSICATDKSGCMTCIQDTIYEKPSAITELDLDNFIKVYPNPYSDYTTIALSGGLINSGTIIISSLDGKTILQRSIRIETEIHISTGLQSGIYFIRLLTEKNEMIKGGKKLVVIR